MNIVNLTKVEKNVLSAIEELIKENDQSPSMREIRDKIGVKSTSGIHRVLWQLERKNIIERTPYSARSIRIKKVCCPHCKKAI